MIWTVNVNVKYPVSGCSNTKRETRHGEHHTSLEHSLELELIIPCKAYSYPLQAQGRPEVNLITSPSRSKCTHNITPLVGNFVIGTTLVQAFDVKAVLHEVSGEVATITIMSRNDHRKRDYVNKQKSYVSVVVLKFWLHVPGYEYAYSQN